MPAAVPADEPPPLEDDLDALFNFDAGIDEALASANRAFDEHERDRPVEPAPQQNVDEEIVVTRKRQPIAKLDQDRILSASGIPRLQKISKQMRFKGRGHEFTDMTRILQMYQLWLDQLYPRAKFADGLALIEKLGHKKGMQVMRKSWIDEGKPKPSVDDDEEVVEDDARDDAAAEESRADETGTPRPGHDTTAPNSVSEAPSGVAANRAQQPFDEEPDGDELDALLAEAQNPAPRKAAAPEDINFDDEEEAMAGMDW